MLTVTAIDMAHSGIPIFDAALEHFVRYLAIDLSNLDLHCLNRNQFTHVDWTLHILLEPNNPLSWRDKGCHS